MVLLALEAGNTDHDHNTVHALDSKRHAAAVDGVLSRLFHGHAEQLAPAILIPGPAAVLVPTAAAPTQNGVALPRGPVLVVLDSAGADRGLEEDLTGAGERNRDQGGSFDGKGQESGIEQVAKLPGVLCGEGGKGEGVARRQDCRGLG